MRIGNIGHVDVITNAGTIWRIIVVAMDGHCGPVTRGSENARDQMRLGIMVPLRCRPRNQRRQR
jgi:hypothetical protein